MLLCQHGGRVIESCNMWCSTSDIKMSRLNKKVQDWGWNVLHTDICGICPSEPTTVSVNEPWQVGTMLAAGSEELCVIMQPWEERLETCKVLMLKCVSCKSKSWRQCMWIFSGVYMCRLVCVSWRCPLERSGSSDRHAESIYIGVWGQMRQSYIWRLGWGGETGLEWFILIMYLTLGMGKNSASKTMTWLTFTEHSKQKEVHFPLIEVCQPVTYSAFWLLFTLHRDPLKQQGKSNMPFST